MMVVKYQEIYLPTLKDYIVICNNSFTKSEILETENNIILTLHFKMSFPTSFCLLDQLTEKIMLEPRMKAFCKYILELSLLEVGILQYNSLVQAASVIFTVSKIFNEETIRINFEEKMSVNESDARESAKELYNCLQRHEISSL